jgi:hypothetical protein
LLVGGAVGGGAGQAGTNPTFNCYQTADNRWIQMLGLETARHWSLLVQCLGISHLVPEKWHTSVAKQRAAAAETLQVGRCASERGAFWCPGYHPYFHILSRDILRYREHPYPHILSRDIVRYTKGGGGEEGRGQLVFVWARRMGLAGGVADIRRRVCNQDAA